MSEPTVVVVAPADEPAVTETPAEEAAQDAEEAAQDAAESASDAVQAAEQAAAVSESTQDDISVLRSENASLVHAIEGLRSDLETLRAELAAPPPPAEPAVEPPDVPIEPQREHWALRLPRWLL